jgi:cytochrome c oxidase subunit 2
MVRMAIAVVALAALCGAARPVAGQGAVKEVDISLKRWEFAPSQIDVTQGQTVRLKVKSLDSKHGIEIKPYKIKKAVAKGGEGITIEFVADKAGTFSITCSEYCGKGHKKMAATLVVAPNATQ